MEQIRKVLMKQGKRMASNSLAASSNWPGLYRDPCDPSSSETVHGWQESPARKYSKKSAGCVLDPSIKQNSSNTAGQEHIV